MASPNSKICSDDIIQIVYLIGYTYDIVIKDIAIRTTISSASSYQKRVIILHAGY